jgi:hypothetical protein
MTILSKSIVIPFRPATHRSRRLSKQADNDDTQKGIVIPLRVGTERAEGTSMTMMTILFLYYIFGK